MLLKITTIKLQLPFRAPGLRASEQLNLGLASETLRTLSTYHNLSSPLYQSKERCTNSQYSSRVLNCPELVLQEFRLVT